MIGLRKDIIILKISCTSFLERAVDLNLIKSFGLGLKVSLVSILKTEYKPRRHLGIKTIHYLMP